MNPPEDPGLFTWLADKAWFVAAGLVGVVWKQNQSAMKEHKKDAANALQAHKEEDDKRIRAMAEEQAVQRSHIGKLFDKLDEHGKRSEDRHLELLKALHEGLGRKADK